MADRESVDGLGLAEAIEALRDDLLKARAEGATSDIQLPVESMTVELTVTATRSREGKAGFKVPIVEVELGGGGSRERGTGQTVTVVFGGPVDREGRPVKVAQAKLGVSADGATLSVDLAVAAITTPDLVRRRVAAGADVLVVAPEEPPLEDVYLRLIHEGAPS